MTRDSLNYASARTPSQDAGAIARFNRWCYAIAVVWVIVSGKSYEISAGKRSRVAGVVAVIAAVSPLTLGTLRLMNVSPLIALLVGFSVLGLFAGSGAGGAVAVVLGAVGKYVTAVFVPLYVAMRRWRALGVMAAVAVAVVGVSVLVMGTGPWRVFFHEMVPTYGRVHTHPWNRSFFYVLMKLAQPGVEHPRPLHGGWLIAARAAQVGTLVGMLAILFTRPAATWRSAAHVMA